MAKLDIIVYMCPEAYPWNPDWGRVFVGQNIMRQEILDDSIGSDHLALRCCFLSLENYAFISIRPMI